MDALYPLSAPQSTAALDEELNTQPNSSEHYCATRLTLKNEVQFYYFTSTIKSNATRNRNAHLLHQKTLKIQQQNAEMFTNCKINGTSTKLAWGRKQTLNNFWQAITSQAITETQGKHEERSKGCFIHALQNVPSVKVMAWWRGLSGPNKSLRWTLGRHLT